MSILLIKYSFYSFIHLIIKCLVCQGIHRIVCFIFRAPSRVRVAKLVSRIAIMTELSFMLCHRGDQLSDPANPTRSAPHAQSRSTAVASPQSPPDNRKAAKERHKPHIKLSRSVLRCVNGQRDVDSDPCQHHHPRATQITPVGECGWVHLDAYSDIRPCLCHWLCNFVAALLLCLLLCLSVCQ